MAASLALLATLPRAGATTISGSFTADNALFVYISTNDAVLGTLVASGNNWGDVFSFSNLPLTLGQNYYIQVEAINYGGPGAFIGQLSLSGTGFTFANGSSTLLTGEPGWSGGYNDSNSNVTQQPWVEPAGSTVSFGLNGISPWNTQPGLSTDAAWIWPSDANSLPSGDNVNGTCGYCTVDFSAEVIDGPVQPAPEPATGGLVAVGLICLGAIEWRRRRWSRSDTAAAG